MVLGKIPMNMNKTNYIELIVQLFSGFSISLYSLNNIVYCYIVHNSDFQSFQDPFQFWGLSQDLQYI